MRINSKHKGNKKKKSKQANLSDKKNKTKNN